MTAKLAVWEKNGKQITGSWEYFPTSNKFVIWLHDNDPVTGERRKVTTHGDKPEFNGWKLLKENPQ
jgi:hypothetical protein